MPTTESDDSLVFNITQDGRYMMAFNDAGGKTRACGATIPDLFASFVERQLPCAKLPPIFVKAMIVYVRGLTVSIGSPEMKYLSALYSDLKAVEHERLRLAGELLMSMQLDGPDNA